MAWEIDWSKNGTTGSRCWGRNPTSHIRKARRWHWMSTGEARRGGVETPTYRKDSWEIDWTKRKNKKVWARNPMSKMPASREWHWISFSTLLKTGIKWRPAFRGNESGRWLDQSGYWKLNRRGMTQEDVELCNKHGIWNAKRKISVPEHRLVALKKYGSLPKGTVVRHINGVKQDNRPENLVLGTTQENTMDHNQARLAAMVWREMFGTLLGIVMSIKGDE